MVEYSCVRCGKSFSQKYHYSSHMRRKTPCESITHKIKAIVEDVVNDKIQTTGLKRNTIDKYYTSRNVVDMCVDSMKTHLDIDKKKDLCIEPSAGNGSFIQKIKSTFKNNTFYDIEPENSNIIKMDYLDFDYDRDIHKKYRKVHVVGNPPFGRQSTLAIKFIKTTAKYADSISFILPKSFKKDSMKKHYPLNFHLKHEIDLPSNSFIVDNTSHDVPCVFQIWEKMDINRPKQIKVDPYTYSFVKKDENPDISFRRVGVYAGKVDKKSEDKSPQSHYFIKFENGLCDKVFSALSTHNYECKENTVGPKSISKQELIPVLNGLLK